jgi:uncharacterized protein (TIGR02301 family)
MIRRSDRCVERNALIRTILAAALAAALALSADFAAAQTGQPAPVGAGSQGQPGDPPYEAQLLRLSEILGAVHYLRKLCDSNEGDLWRDQMQAILDAEQPSPIRRARFVDQFNRGYESFRSVYRSCTPAAALAIDKYMDEGVKITRDITTRYGKS